MVNSDEVSTAIKKVLPDSEVIVQDLNGTGDHLQVDVVSSAFNGLSKISQHQLVYGALKEELANESIHALALNTSIPS